MKNIKEPRYLKIPIVVLLLFQGISGLFGGLALILDPSGSIINLDIKLLSYSPFSDFFIPGLILLLVLGIYPIMLLFGYIKDRNWTRMGMIILGIALPIWIMVEIILIGYIKEPPLQLIYGLTGLIILVLALFNYIRK